MWPEEVSSTLTERAFRFASMISQSLVKGPKVDGSFSWVLFCVFFFSDLRLIVYCHQIKVPGCIHPIFELLSNFQRLDWSSVCFHVCRFMTNQQKYIYLNITLTEMVSTIHFLCFQVLFQIYNIQIQQHSLIYQTVSFYHHLTESLNLSGIINMVSSLATTRLNLNWIRDFTYLDLWFNRVLCWNAGVSTKNTRKHLWVLFKLPLSCIWGYSERDL